jgi:chromosome segregation ATPase
MIKTICSAKHKWTGFLFFLLLVLLTSCASKKTKTDIENLNTEIGELTRIIEDVGVNQGNVDKELIKNRVERLEIKGKLLELDSAGKANSDEALALKDRLNHLDTEYQKFSKKVTVIEKKVSKNEDSLDKINSSDLNKKKVLKNHINEWNKIEQESKKLADELNNSNELTNKE